jgi:hypothetical protein
MSLNKYDFDAHRHAKRMRALKIDFIIIVTSLLLGIWMMTDHPPPASNAPAFHKANALERNYGARKVQEVLARSLP